MVDIPGFFKNFRDRIRAAVSVKAQNFLFFFALTLVVVLAIMIRMTPILRGPLIIKAFDPWIQYYNAAYISEHSLYDYFHWHDYKVWYPTGRLRSFLNPGLPFTAATVWYILNLIGIPITIFEVCIYFPAFMGGITVLTCYYLGKEMLDRKCGLFAAFFLAFNSGHMQRTMVGFFDNETIGVFASLMTLLFFLKTVRTGKYYYGVIAGIALGYLFLGWGGADYIFYLLPLVCGILVLINKYNENVLIAYGSTIGTSLFVSGLYAQFGYGDLFSKMTVGGVFFFTLILLVFHIIYINKEKYPRFYDTLITGIKTAIIPGAIIVGIIIWVSPESLPLGLGSRFQSILSPLIRDQQHLTASVAEHMPSAWSVFYYNTLIPLMLLPLGIFFCFKRGEAPEILLMVFLLTLFYFTGSMIRIILLFAPAAALMGSYGLVNVLKIYGSFTGQQSVGVSRKRRRQVKRPVGRGEIMVVYSLVGILCFAQIVQGADISINQLSYSQIVAGGTFHDWEESLTWMKTNLKGTDVVVSWWDYGYWLTPIGNVTTVNDNATFNSTRIGATGMALMQTDEIESAKVLQKLHANYILVFFGFLVNGLGGDEGKWPWMLRICNDNYGHYKANGYEADNWEKDSVFDEAKYVNESTGLYEDSWFDSQLVRLMFYDEATDPNRVADPNNNYLKWNYASNIAGNTQASISQRKDDNGNTWASHIPIDGQYDFKVFKKAYFSKSGMVKLFKVDYTALESGFSIIDPKIHDNGYGTFNIQNTGNRNLTITKVEINNEEYNFTMDKGGSINQLKEEMNDIVWVDALAEDFQVDDVVNITVTALADALDNSYYEFIESTKSFFVTPSEAGSIKINRANSKVVQIDDITADIYLEVENDGNSIVKLKKFYVYDDNDTAFQFNYSTYLTGSRILEPGGKAYIHLPNAPVAFSPIGLISQLVGVKTSTGEQYETLFSSNEENYKLSIIPEDRIISPELQMLDPDFIFRDNIPIDLQKTFIYSYDNGSNHIQIKVENTGETVLGLEGVNIALLEEYIDEDLDFDTIDHNMILAPGSQNTIIADGSSLDITINDQIGMFITGIDYNGDIVASDVGIIHSIRNKPDIKIIEYGRTATTPDSYIWANETGRIVVKNTGNEAVQLKNIYLNNTLASSINYIQGDSYLDMQESAIIAFTTPNIKLNQSHEVVVKVDTYSTAEYTQTFNVYVNPSGINYYDVDINPTNTIAEEGFDLTVRVYNYGIGTLVVDTFNINETYVPISEFTYITDTISSNNYVDYTISLADLKTLLGLASDIVKGDKLVILVRTKQGAEDTKTIIAIN